jgi:hypothetical protein
MDYIGVAEMQCTHAKHIDRRIHKANHIRPSEEGTAQLCGHNYWIV